MVLAHDFGHASCSHREPIGAQVLAQVFHCHLQAAGAPASQVNICRFKSHGVNQSRRKDQPEVLLRVGKFNLEGIGRKLANDPLIVNLQPRIRNPHGPLQERCRERLRRAPLLQPATGGRNESFCLPAMYPFGDFL